MFIFKDSDSDLSSSSGTGDGEPDDVATLDAAGHGVHLPTVTKTVRSSH